MKTGLRLVLVLFLLVPIVNCATSSGGSDEDVSAEDSGTNDQAADSAPETGNADLAAEANADQVQPEPTEPAVTDQAPPPETAQATPEQSAPAEPAPAPEQAPPQEPAPTEPPAQAEAAPEPTGQKVRITNLEYKSNLNGGTIVITSNGPLQYSSRTNEKGQFIIDMSNTTVPKRFRRPYNTKEFGGAIASFNAYQSKESKSDSKLVVQLKSGSGEPAVSQEGNILYIAGSGVAGGGGEAPSGAAEAPPAEDAGGEPAQAAAAEGETFPDENVLTNKSVNDFLTGNVKFYGRPIDIEFRDADIKDVLRFIAEETGLNLLTGDDISGKISVKLRRVPWDQALTVILQAKKLGYVKQGSVLRVAPLAALQSEAEASKNVLESQKLLQPLRIKLFPISYAKAEELENQVKEFLSTRGRARADKRTNTLVVTDIDENLAKVKGLITRLDTQTPQVLIEAKIVEARETFEKAVGVNWGFNGFGMKVSDGPNGAVNLTPHLRSSPSNATGAATLDLGLLVGTLDLFGDLDATLKLLETERLVKVISSPRVMALDRTTARIEQTTQFPNFGSITTANGVAQTSITFQDVKLKLVVTPQITVDGAVMMDVNVAREFPEPPIPPTYARAINKREAATQVLVENGDTIVIGGIYQSDVGDAENGIPWLRKIPILGALFRSRTTTKEKNELVIFLTPKIVNRDKAFVKNEESQ